ncbi:MAG TPA: alpha/beta hydrolase [Fimbriimonadaceae bacterium]|nr:alpha/beta hydrolase [Fimbriimonadaceae bacterium]
MSETFIHRFEPGVEGETRTLLLLHGTGGDENDLIPLGQTVLPGAAILSPRGRVFEGDFPRFFRRFAEGVFDLENLYAETAALAEFVVEAAGRYAFDLRRIVALGFSNGANMAHSLMMRHPNVVQDAVLIRAMTTLPELQPTGLEGKRVFLSSGKVDPMMPVDDVEFLANQLRSGGADVTHHWVDAGHNLTRAELGTIHDWLAQ